MKSKLFFNVECNDFKLEFKKVSFKNMKLYRLKIKIHLSLKI